ncbi:MAG: putative thiamine pyrophosphokinae [Actinomycetota bacterium]
MGTTSRCAVIVGGGPIISPVDVYDLVIAADSGLDVARAAGLEPNLLVGDLDSITASGLRWADDHAIEIQRHPADKDQTDAALALEQAAARGAEALTLHGPAHTDRLDHLLGALIALGAPHMATMERVSAQFGTTTVHVLHPGRTVNIELPPNAVFSLLALHGGCTGVSVQGARWPLDDAALQPAETRGISNQSIGTPVLISVATGVLTVIVPEVLS